MAGFDKTLKKETILLTRIAALALLMSLMPGIASAAGEMDAIQASLEKNNPKLKIKSIKASEVEGVYEVYANGVILYTDKSGRYVFAGTTLIEDATKRNLTAERMKALTRIAFDELPFKDAIEIRKGNGAYRFAVFSDPDCPYCKTLEQGLEKLGMTDYTAYVFLYPLEEIHPEARAKSESIWCATDRASAWNAWMKEGKLPQQQSCAHPIDANRQLGDKLGVAATPTIYLGDGTQAASPDELVAALRAKK